MIGTNKKDALETVRHLFADVEAGTLMTPAKPDPDAVVELLGERGVRYVTFEDWQAIDQAEVGRGEPHGRPRVKFVRVEEMLDTVGEKLAGWPMPVDLEELRGMIETALPGAAVEVFDEDGGGQHLRAEVAAPQFEGLPRIQQHRLVKAAVKTRFDDGTIHALSVKTSVPA